MHNAYVLNDSSDRDHLLAFKKIDNARDLFSLVSMAIFLNVLDERTYQLSSDTPQEDRSVLRQYYDVFDLNAIPVVERHHLCYTRGLSIDLLEWFFENYSFSSEELEDDDIDANSHIFVPFVVHIGRQLVRYKRAAESRGHTTLPTSEDINRQVQNALFGFEFMQDTWIEEKAEYEELNHHDDRDNEWSENPDYNDLNFDISKFTFTQREHANLSRPIVENLFEKGKTIADCRFFRGLASQSNLEELGTFHAYR